MVATGSKQLKTELILVRKDVALCYLQLAQVKTFDVVDSLEETRWMIACGNMQAGSE